MHFKKIIFALLFAFVFETSHAGLGSQLALYKSNPQARPSEEVVNILKNYHVVFVAGFANEVEVLTRQMFITSKNLGYFVHNSNVLEELGIKASVYRPTSWESIETSAEILSHQIDYFYEVGGKKPLLLIGHSRGGPVVVNMLLNHPELIRNKIVKKVMTMQSPVFGNDFPALNSFKIVGRFWLPGEAGFLGFRALEPEKIERAIGTEKFLELAKRDQKLVSNSVLWFASSKPAENIMSRTEKKFAKAYRSERYVPNDSVVATPNMWREDYGNLIGYTENLSHLEPVAHLGKAAKAETERTIRSFTYALADSLAENIATSSEQAQRISAGVKGSIGLEQPLRPEPAPAGSSIFRECITLIKLVLLPP